MTTFLSTAKAEQHFNLVEPEDEDVQQEAENRRRSIRASRNSQLSSSCHTSSSSSFESILDSPDDRCRPQRQMRRLSFGSCHTTVEIDQKMPVMDSLLQEYDSPASVITSKCRWKAEVALSPPTKRHTIPKQSRPTWNALNAVSKVMPKVPSRSRATPNVQDETL